MVWLCHTQNRCEKDKTKCLLDAITSNNRLMINQWPSYPNSRDTITSKNDFPKGRNGIVRPLQLKSPILNKYEKWCFAQSTLSAIGVKTPYGMFLIPDYILCSVFIKNVAFFINKSRELIFSNRSVEIFWERTFILLTLMARGF